MFTATGTSPAELGPAPAVLERLRHDEDRQRVDEPGLFGHGDELIRWHQTEPGRVPAHERLCRDDGPGIDAELRLVVDDELALVDRPPQVTDQRQLGRGVAVLIRAVGRDSDVSVLGGVHRDVRRAASTCRCPRRGPGTPRRRRCPRRRAPCRRCRPARAGPRGSGSPSRARPSASGRSARTTPNSSPPSRATVSPSRTASCRRGPSRCSRRSPVWWPSVSLISLNRSRSSRIRPARRSVDAAAVIARLARSWNSDRFGRPVRESCVDWCSFSADTTRGPVGDHKRHQESWEQPDAAVGGDDDDGREAEERNVRGGLEGDVLAQDRPDRQSLDDRERDVGHGAVDDEEDDGGRDDAEEVTRLREQRRRRSDGACR